jgi:hypothetical protein
MHWFYSMLVEVANSSRLSEKKAFILHSLCVGAIRANAIREVLFETPGFTYRLVDVLSIVALVCDEVEEFTRKKSGVFGPSWMKVKVV